MRNQTMRRGTLVEVRPAAEILRSLDASGSLERLPFMPEMLQFAGQRFVVDARAEKVCDTINGYGSRRLKDTVLLGGLRCDGSGHGGCEAECRLFWKEAWLRPVETTDPPPSSGAGPVPAALVELLSSAASQGVGQGTTSEVRYTCQATELFRASGQLRSFDPIPFVREFTCGNVPFGKFLRIAAKAAVLEPARKLRLLPEVHVVGSRTGAADDKPLDLRPGDLVQVKSREEIAATLTVKGRHRGLWFDREMLPYCGGTYRVRRRVSRLIEEPTGKMIELKNDCLVLEGVVCSGEHSLKRWMCVRQIYPYWREAWLRRVEPAELRSDGPRLQAGAAR